MVPRSARVIETGERWVTAAPREAKTAKKKKKKKKKKIHPLIIKRLLTLH